MFRSVRCRVSRREKLHVLRRAERPFLVDESRVAVLNVQLVTVEQIVAVVLEEVHASCN